MTNLIRSKSTNLKGDAMNKEEIWKDLINHNNYQISSYGNIKSKNYKRQGFEKILKQSINGRGYNYVLISENNKYKNILIHKAVANAFIPNIDNLTDVNHKDGNKQNNNIDNLEWCTRSYNIQHAYNTGLKKGGKGMTYKKRCELAIEYIENYTHKEELNIRVKDYNFNLDELLVILKGGNNDK